MESTVLKTDNLKAFFGTNEVLKGINISISTNKITALIGPSGCGKTTFMRCVNRMHELVKGARVEGNVYLNGEDVYKTEPIFLRRKVGMVFQRPNPFPSMSIYDNVLAAYKLNAIRLHKKEQNQIVEDSLKKAALWDEVKDNLKQKGTFLSGGQQQRLCIARAIAMQPHILLLDEPTSALDPISTASIEKLLCELKAKYTILIVTHNIQQASRLSDDTAFFLLGELIEFSATKELFTNPKNEKTQNYVTGRFG